MHFLYVSCILYVRIREREYATQHNDDANCQYWCSARTKVSSRVCSTIKFINVIISCGGFFQKSTTVKETIQKSENLSMYLDGLYHWPFQGPRCNFQLD